MFGEFPCVAVRVAVFRKYVGLCWTVCGSVWQVFVVSMLFIYVVDVFVVDRVIVFLSIVVLYLVAWFGGSLLCVMGYPSLRQFWSRVVLFVVCVIMVVLLVLYLAVCHMVFVVFIAMFCVYFCFFCILQVVMLQAVMVDRRYLLAFADGVGARCRC